MNQRLCRNVAAVALACVAAVIASTVHAQAPNIAAIKLISYDSAKYGSSAERNRLLKKWGDEVKALPK